MSGEVAGLGLDGPYAEEIGDTGTVPGEAVAVLVKDEAGVYTQVDKATSLLLGWTAEDLVGHRSLEFIHADDHDRALDSWIQLLTTGQTVPIKLRHQRSNGTWLWVEFRNNLFRGASGAGYVICELVDVSSEMDPDADASGVPQGFRPRLALVHKDELAVIIGVDHAATQMLDWPAEELIGMRSLDLIHPDDHARAIASWARILTTRTRQRIRLRHLRRDGSWIWVEITNHFVEGEPGKGQVIAEMLDVSEEMAAQEALRRRERLFRRLAESLPIGLFQIDQDGRVVYANARLHAMLGTPPAETAADQLAAVDSDDRGRTLAALTGVLTGVDQDLEIRVRAPGRHNAMLCTLTMRSLPEEDGVVSGALITVADVTESARLRAELEIRATYDALTSCYNRASIMAILAAELERRDGILVGAVFIDLDGFKLVNDQHGHATGDELLIVVAARLRASVRSRDLVARIGGDEFLIVSPDISGPQEAMGVAKRLRDALDVVAELSSGRVTPRASIGVACSTLETTSADELVAQADSAMYESKRIGAGQPVAVSHTRPRGQSPEGG